MYYLPILPLPRDRIIFIFLLLGLIPRIGTLYFISSTVSGPCPADTVISRKGQDGGSSEPKTSTSLLYNTYKITHQHMYIYSILHTNGSS